MTAACPSAEGEAGPVPPHLLRVGGTATDRAILIVLDRHGRAPLSVAKLPVIAAEMVEAEGEAAMLNLLTGITGVPRLIRHWQGIGYAGLAQSFVPGDRMDTLVAMARLPPLAAAVTDWLADLAAATAGPADARWLNDLAARSLDELAASLAGEPGLDQLLARSRQLLTFERPLPPVAQHRDLGPWNLLLGPDQAVGVIDWVDGARDGVPLADLVHFLAHLVLSASGGYRPQGRDLAIATMHDTATVAGATVAACQRSYAARLGLAPAEVTRLRVLTWVLDILRQDPQHRATSLYTTLWRDEVNRNQ